MITKQKAEYVQKANKEHCRDCNMFRPPQSCTLVEGVINAGGHCRYFVRKRKNGKLCLPVED